MNLFELKENMANLQAGIREDAEWIAEKGADPATPMEELNAKKQHRDELQARYDMVKAEHDRMEAAQREKVKQKASTTPADDLIQKKAAFYRAALTGGDVHKAYEGLGAVPTGTADLGNGEHLLPKNVSNNLILEPNEVNPLREIAHVTNVTGLEEPKLGFTIEDADIADVTDEETAKEIEMEGGTVVYGRYKMKVVATIKDTVLHGTDADLVSAVEGALRSALAKREKYLALLPKDTAATDTAHAHMSFYKEGAITAVEGATLYDAIVAAYASLPDDFAANARVVMRKEDYYGMVRDLTNDSEALFGSKPASILGLPVVFCDKAKTPLVGDFTYYGINYDIDSIFETDKDAKKGEYYFVFTAWGDQQIRLKSAFRLAVVKANP